MPLEANGKADSNEECNKRPLFNQSSNPSRPTSPSSQSVNLARFPAFNPSCSGLSAIKKTSDLVNVSDSRVGDIL